MAAGLLALLPLSSDAVPVAERQRRLDALREEITRLRSEVAALSAREQGVLGELERLGAELRLHEAERAAVELRLEDVEEAIGRRLDELSKLEQVQSRRLRYLSFRLREIYKAGPDEALRRWIGADEPDPRLDGLRYAAYLSERDGRMLEAYRRDRARLLEERRGLETSRAELERLRQDAERAELRVTSSRRSRNRSLALLREDRTRRESAITELESAARELGRTVEALAPGGEDPLLDMQKFRGLLDWPADGRVTAGFGSVVHPKFGTRVPHPGLDIEGRSGDPIRAVFEGEVVFAAWMRGYGLTAVIDHGRRMLSIYSHASVLLVEPGQQVLKGQSIGKMGETGSLRGTYLYFELRVDGAPVDPVPWLRRGPDVLANPAARR